MENNENCCQEVKNFSNLNTQIIICSSKPNSSTINSPSISNSSDSSSSRSSDFSNSSIDTSEEIFNCQNENNLNNYNQSKNQNTKNNENLDDFNEKRSKNYIDNCFIILNKNENLKNSKKNLSTSSTKSSSVNSLNKTNSNLNSFLKNSLNKKLPFNSSLNFLNQNNIDKKFLNNKPYNDNLLSNTKFTNNYEPNQSIPNIDKLNLSKNSPKRYISNSIDSSLPQSNDPVCLDNSENRMFSKYNLNDSIYIWFLNRFKTNGEFNLENENKKLKILNEKQNDFKVKESQSDCKENQSANLKSIKKHIMLDENSKENDSSILIPGPSGLQNFNSKSKNYLENEKISISSNNINEKLDKNNSNTTYVEVESWRFDNNCPQNNSSINNRMNEYFDSYNQRTSVSSNQNYNEYPTLVCSEYKTKQSQNQSKKNQQNSKLKKAILLPKLHNEFCKNTSSPHQNNSSHTNSSSNVSTSRSSSSNSSNFSNLQSNDCEAKKKNIQNYNPKLANSNLSGSLSSVSSGNNFDPLLPICKICHLNGKEDDPLISPCKCSGTMQFIHCKCLLKWLEISKKKSRKPLSCELCQYQYQWHKKFKVGQWQFPKCSSQDKFLHCGFLITLIVMIFSIVFLFRMQEPVIRLEYNKKNNFTANEPATISLAILFVISFFISLYAQVKAETTLHRLIMNFIYLNQQWYINEYEKKDNSDTPESV